MKLPIFLAVLAGCAAGAAAACAKTPLSNPPVPPEAYAKSIDPVIKYILNRTPPKVHHPFFALLGPYGPLPNLTDHSTVLKWHELLLASIRGFTSQAPYQSYPTAVARALFVVQTAVYDAWAAYDKDAIGVYWPTHHFRRPASEATEKNIAEAAAFAAYQATVDLFPGAQPSLLEYLKATTPSFSNGMLTCTNNSVAACLGNSAAANVIHGRANDNSNQEGNYADTTDYQYPDPKNYSAWQRLEFNGVCQNASTPFWREVTSFALKNSSQFIPPSTTTFLYDKGPGKENYDLQAADILAYSTTLDDRTKVIGDYWADFTASNLPPGHWTQYAEWVLSTAPKDKYKIEDEIKLLFALSAALLDASISAWDTKYFYTAVRPITAITKVVYKGKEVAAYKRGDPQSKTPTLIKGDDWEPFQPPNNSVTPPFPAFVSGHSTFGGAFETVLQNFTGSDRFGLEIVVPKGFLPSELPQSMLPGSEVPAFNTTLYYPTFSYSSEENGISRLYNGVHFSNDNICGRAQGIAAGLQAFERYKALIAGKDIKRTDPEKPYIRKAFEKYMEQATMTPTGQKVRLRIVA